MGFFGQEYKSELPSPTPGDLPNPGVEPASPVSSVGEFFTTESPWKPKSVSPQERVSLISCLFGSLFQWDLSWWIPLSMFFLQKKKCIHEFLVSRSRDSQTSVKKEEIYGLKEERNTSEFGRTGRKHCIQLELLRLTICTQFYCLNHLKNKLLRRDY